MFTMLTNGDQHVKTLLRSATGGQKLHRVPLKIPFQSINVPAEVPLKHLDYIIINEYIVGILRWKIERFS